MSANFDKLLSASIAICNANTLAMPVFQYHTFIMWYYNTTNAYGVMMYCIYTYMYVAQCDKVALSDDTWIAFSLIFKYVAI